MTARIELPQGAVEAAAAAMAATRRQYGNSAKRIVRFDHILADAALQAAAPIILAASRHVHYFELANTRIVCGTPDAPGLRASSVIASVTCHGCKRTVAYKVAAAAIEGRLNKPG